MTAPDPQDCPYRALHRPPYYRCTTCRWGQLWRFGLASYHD